MEEREIKVIKIRVGRIKADFNMKGICAEVIGFGLDLYNHEKFAPNCVAPKSIS